MLTLKIMNTPKLLICLLISYILLFYVTTRGSRLSAKGAPSAGGQTPKKFLKIRCKMVFFKQVW